MCAITLTSARQDVFKLQACSFLLTLIISSFQTSDSVVFIFLFLSYLPRSPLWRCVPACILRGCVGYCRSSPDFRELLEPLCVLVTAATLSRRLHSPSVGFVYSLWACVWLALLYSSLPVFNSMMCTLRRDELPKPPGCHRGSTLQVIASLCSHFAWNFFSDRPWHCSVSLLLVKCVTSATLFRRSPGTRVGAGHEY